MSRLLIKHGRVVDPSQRLDEGLNVLIVDGKVARIAERIEDKEADIFDATGLVIAPGFVDVHVHLREPGFEYKETIATGTAAADRIRMPERPVPSPSKVRLRRMTIPFAPAATTIPCAASYNSANFSMILPAFFSCPSIFKASANFFIISKTSCSDFPSVRSKSV